MSFSRKRLNKELVDLSKSRDLCGKEFVIELMEDDEDDFNVKITFEGPAGTAYSSGKFVVGVRINEHFPFKPPQVELLTKVWNTNVDPHDQAFCLDILSYKYTPGITLLNVLLTIQGFFLSGDVEYAMNSAAEKQWQNCKSMYEKTAFMWTHRYAGGPHGIEEYEVKINQLIEVLEIEYDEAIKVLSYTGWDVDSAANFLME